MLDFLKQEPITLGGISVGCFMATVDNIFWYKLDQFLMALGYTGNVSFAQPARDAHPEAFCNIKGKIYVNKEGINHIIKQSNKPKAKELYDQICKVAFSALDAGFMDGNNFLSIAPKSEYIQYHPTLNSCVSTRKIAQCFNKAHSKVLRDFEEAIEKLQKGLADFGLSSEDVTANTFQYTRENYKFERVTYLNAQNKAQPEILVSEGLFNAVVLGYTGKEAFQWRLLFIDEFLKLRLNVQKLRAAPSLTEKLKRATSQLYVFMDANEDGLYKIGITERPVEQRLKEMNANVVSKVSCLWVSPHVTNASKLEAELHKYFAEYKVTSEYNPSLSEWFRLGTEQLVELQSLLRFNFKYLDLEINLIK